MRMVLLAGMLAIGAAGTARADTYSFTYSGLGTSATVSGILTGSLVDGGTVFDITGVSAFDVNGTPVGTLPTVSSTDAYLFGGTKTPSASLNESVIDFTLSAGPSMTLFIGVGDQTAAYYASNFGYASGAAYATSSYGGVSTGNVVPFVPADYSFSVATTAVPEPASAALLGAGVFGLGLIRRRRGAGRAKARALAA